MKSENTQAALKASTNSTALFETRRKIIIQNSPMERKLIYIA